MAARRPIHGLVVMALLAGSLPATVAAVDEPTYAVGITWTTPGSATVHQPPESLQVGATVTLTPLLGNAGSWPNHRCWLFIEGFESQANWLRMQVSGDSCAPWTFVVPPAPLGSYRIGGFAVVATGTEGDAAAVATDQFIDLVAGGSAQPYSSVNYPARSWALADLVSDATPSFGSPWTIAGHPGADGCQLMFSGGFESAWVRQADGCAAWTMTVPPPTPNAFPTFFGELSQVLVYSWTGTSAWDRQDPDIGLRGAAWSETYNVALADFAAGPNTAYASNLPAVFVGPARNQAHYTTDPGAHDYEPVVRGLAEGTCRYVSASTVPSAPLSGGACEEPASIPAWDLEVNGTVTLRIELDDGEGTLVAGAGTDIGYMQPMDTPEVDLPLVVEEDEPTSITASADDGAPAQYEIVIDAATPALAPAATAAIVVTGSFDPSVEKSGDAVTINRTFTTAGIYEIEVAFTDAKGATKQSARQFVVGDPFTDVVGSAFRTDVYWLLLEGITKGCGPTSYCPDAPVTREQMASFLDRALNLPPTPNDYFTDDESSSHEGAINRLAASGITAGCAPGRFCPTASVKRDQMASFIARAFHLPSTPTDFFTDDAGNTHQADINRVAAAGITKGCGPTTYCPGAEVTRGQMAAFLHRALD